ncbi:putative branched-chain amino acid aminotransferase [Rosellinia necatrix]|uniref:Branched-chain-amino-acid aminotransferase n=1 Tax=Rosellinia necatrix TaxID=77044 RepID=A0A1W2TME9_ROSNE|nr:putative branched-chain amino acid aminotransferase [Rosellinia necatrix]
MTPSAISQNGHGGEQDLDLTSSAIEHQMAESQPSSGNATGVASNGVAQPNELDASKLIYNLTQNPREPPAVGITEDNGSSICTDHMITVRWTAKNGWDAPELKPYGPFSLMPTASVLHYATECFEGLKVYRGHDGKLRLFRPDRNCERMRMSSVRISLPSFPPAELEKLILTLMSVDGPKWLPRARPGTFLYLRPTMIGTQSQLGVQAPSEALLYVIASFMPPLDSPAGGMKLHTSPDDMVRAWVGGFGYAKVGANYGPSLMATKEARARGFHQILWLYGKDGECTEAGASNFFVVWKTREGRTQIVTAPLDDRLILAGVTRSSVVALAKERLGGDAEVVERKYTIDEVMEASAEGRLLESFASGTAYFVCPISLIHHRGRDIQIPTGKGGDGGPLTLRLKKWLIDIKYGREEHPWGVVVPEEH